MLKSLRQQSFWQQCGLLSLYILLAIAIVYLYVSQEQTFFFWDRAAYYNWAWEMTQTFRESPQLAWQEIRQSLASDYNKLYILPLIPLMRLAGQSRMSYIASVALVYQIPLGLILGKIASSITSSISPRLSFWSAAFLTLVIPSTWYTLLEGYPDIGGTLGIAGAILVYSYRRPFNSWNKIPVIGLLIALAFMFRRHFGYAALSFLLGLCFQETILKSQKLAKLSIATTLREGSMPVIKVALISLCSLFWIALLTPSLLHYVLQQNLTKLYSSYAISLAHVFTYYKVSFGWGMWLFGILGLGIATATTQSLEKRRVLLLLLGYLGFSVLIWWGYLRYPGVHYNLHFTLPLTLGVVSLFDWLYQFQSQILLRGFLIFYLILNFTIGLTPWMSGHPAWLNYFFVRSQPPVQRQDYREIKSLVRYLHEIPETSFPLYVASSSQVFNSDLLQNASVFFSGQYRTTFNLVPTPEVDSRDFYPLEGLLKSQSVIIATPFQHHLSPLEQDVVRVVVNAFNKHREISQDFERLPRQFFLQKDVVVSIYQRIQPTAIPVAIRTLDWMQAQIGDRPGTQLDWIILSQLFPSSVVRHPDSSYRIFTHPTASFLYIDELSPMTQIRGEVQFADSQCIGTTLQFSTVDAEGTPLQVVQQQLTPHQDGKFSLSLAAAKARYLQMDVLNYEPNASPNHCALEIQSLQIQGNQTPQQST
ncbi:hypothetical protein H6G20_11110 [Desertifilum sp. FACHB-1129]|uniref:Glycosyltransferase RgtA/B/C/D-like domain-containing protein n=2 Tax=Desertifilum tharense IPPAS B-1220 TaxID=1781255 RepID=A0A1E5QR23_9CYAN|nr:MULTISPECIES: hypothetical protein [Desertifilum]MDA0210725.1 hypothetical protein [Cyanobacteria bacterium FC1]MBD2312211.1 hypothetical protein [Desertifilum sp. FACHB-1129]MBD2323722.1 hypothetical protein [Desertifilum sp. FACHB-866]MBD2332419.1 hypothetical protein [Desertifilum sp. FACHB-868]OEJ77102.1 hypothetical protein BH720_01345 [Desertifilum tharense IPPAS B-1220]